jgi:transposase
VPRSISARSLAERQQRIGILDPKRLFRGDTSDGRRAAAIYTLIETAKLNDVDPQAWLADVLARLQDQPAKRIDELLPWNWQRERQQKAAA